MRTSDIWKEAKLNQIPNSALLAARVYAISSRSRIVFGVLGFLILGNLIFSAVCPVSRPL